LKWDVCITPRKQTSVSYAADCDAIICGGGAKPDDLHLLSVVHCVDEEIISWLEKREAKRRHVRSKAHNGPKSDIA
jgi:hypothetical protein